MAQSVISMTYVNRLMEYADEKWFPEIKQSKQATLKKRNLCDPCGRRSLRKMPKDHNPDDTVNFPKIKDNRKKEESDLMLVS